MTSYNYTNGYSVLSYLEYPIILVQEYILIFLVLKYLNKVNVWSLLCTIVYFTLSSCLLLEIVPKIVLTFLAVSKIYFRSSIFNETLKSILIAHSSLSQKRVWIFSLCARRFPLPVKSSSCWLYFELKTRSRWRPLLGSYRPSRT